MDKIKKKVLELECGCHLWLGCRNTDGYPKFHRKYKGKQDANIKGHRYVYEQTKGEIPEGHVVRHTCDNILCLNPDHLITGTSTDNTMDRVERKRTNKGISKEVVDEIYAMKTSGLSQRAVADIFGVSQTGVSKIWRNFYVRQTLNI